MEGIILLLVALAIWMFIGPFIALSAKGKSNELEESLNKLQKKFSELEKELEKTRAELSWKNKSITRTEKVSSCHDEHRKALVTEEANQEQASSTDKLVQQDTNENIDHYFIDEQSGEEKVTEAHQEQPITNLVDAISSEDHKDEIIADVVSKDAESVLEIAEQVNTTNVAIEIERENSATELLTEIIDHPLVAEDETANSKDDQILREAFDEDLLSEISAEVQSNLAITDKAPVQPGYSPLATERVSQPIKQVTVATRKPAAPIMTWLMKAIQWFGQGNVPVKVGMLILLFGVGALLKYAVDQSWFTMTHALSAVGVAGISAFAFAYTKRESHRVFSLTLQGGSLGVLLLTLFAASQIEKLMSLDVAFILSFILIMVTAILSVRQNAVVLAAFSIATGFMAPIWLSSGSNNYVGLFSYYTLLNVGIIFISWFKPWQKLNLLGFVFTFFVGISWGVLRYEPANFSTTEPFLLIFFGLYLIIPIFYANRMKDQKERMVDAILVFGNPLLALSIQCYLLDYSRPLILFNALGLAVIYGGLTFAIRRFTEYRLLRIAYTALFWLFVMLAVPLAFAAEHTSIIYAFFAAMIFWWAEKTDDVYTKTIAIIFHVLSIGSVLYSLTVNGTSFDALVPSFMSLALTAFFIAYQCIRNGHKLLEMSLLLDGLFFWLLMGGVRIAHLDWSINFNSHFALFLAITALLFSTAYCVMARMTIGKQFIYRALAFMHLMAGFALPIIIVLERTLSGVNYLVSWNLASWYALLAVFWGMLWQHRQSQKGYILMSQLVFWTGALVMLLMNFKWLADIAFASDVARFDWRWVFISLPLLAMYAVRSFREEYLICPFKANRYVLMPEAFGTLIFGIFVVWFKILTLAGQSILLPVWLPILNVFDSVQLLMVSALIYYIWQHYSGRIVYIISGFAVLMINVVIARAIHHWFGYAWGIETLATCEFFLACTLVYPLLTALFVKFGNSEERLPFYHIALASQCMVLIATFILTSRFGLSGIDHWYFAIGGMINAVSALYSAYILYRREEAWFYRIFYATGIAWWFMAGFVGLYQKFLGLNLSASILLFTIMTGAAASHLHKIAKDFIRELVMTACASIFFGILYFIAIVGEVHLLGEGRAIVWLLYVAMSYWILHNLRLTKVIEVEAAHVALLGVNLVVVMVELYYWLGLMSVSTSVHQLAITLPLMTVLTLALSRWSYLLLPLTENRLLPKVIVQRALVALTATSIICTQLLSGIKFWAVWLPIFNSVEFFAYVYLALIVKFASSLGWSDKKYQVITLTSVCALISMSVVRACYHYVPLPRWDLFILSNETVQMALTIVWTMLGFTLWIYGSKKRNQLIWRLGALLMGLVLLKLIVIDRTNLGNVMGIISFIGYGLFCLVIGYLAPQPPKEVIQEIYNDVTEKMDQETYEATGHEKSN